MGRCVLTRNGPQSLMTHASFKISLSRDHLGGPSFGLYTTKCVTFSSLDHSGHAFDGYAGLTKVGYEFDLIVRKMSSRDVSSYSILLSRECRVSMERKDQEGP
jgi:hypothetical protein